MVFRSTKNLKDHIPDILFLAGITVLVSLPYITRDFLPIEHDTFFHVSRIEHLSQSISAGSFFPAVYFSENMSYGYASPLFYSDFFLIPAALFHLAGCSLSFCYRFAVITAVFFSAFTMFILAQRISERRDVSYIASAAYLFANYRITDIYVRGALGEILAFIFIPLVLLGLYEILEKNHVQNHRILTAGLCGLILSHNLTFLMTSLLCCIIFVILIRKCTKDQFIALCRSVLSAFLLTAFFTLPMIEQLKSQTFILDYYASNSDLASGSMKLWQYFVNQTIFGYSGNTLEKSRTMTVNIGWFLTLAPLLWIMTEKKLKKQYTFVTLLLVLGYIFWFMPAAVVPWDILPFKILQFPWRLNTLAVTLLCIPAAFGTAGIIRKKKLQAVILLLLCCECLYHVYPDYSRTFGMENDDTWQDVLDGKLCDPCYSAYYVRAELGGADYLPVSFPDIRNWKADILSLYTNETAAAYEDTRDDGFLQFHLSDQYAGQRIELPVTWYKGYKVYLINGSQYTEIKVDQDVNGFVSFIPEEAGEYLCIYTDTYIRRISSYLSLASCIILLTLRFRKKIS